MHGSTGTVFGLVKSFIVPHPNDPSLLIQYASVEGPEAAIYFRGKAELADGNAYVAFPEHFTAMAAPGSVTVSLTPRSASSLGLAAVGVTEQGVEVAELGGGAGSYAFDFVVYAVRQGYEDFKVILEKDAGGGPAGLLSQLEAAQKQLAKAGKAKQ